jgi:hypothetical protein
MTITNTGWIDLETCSTPQLLVELSYMRAAIAAEVDIEARWAFILRAAEVKQRIAVHNVLEVRRLEAAGIPVPLEGVEEPTIAPLSEERLREIEEQCAENKRCGHACSLTDAVPELLTEIQRLRLLIAKAQ